MEHNNSTPQNEEMGITHTDTSNHQQNDEKKTESKSEAKKLSSALDLIKYGIAKLKQKKDNILPLLAINIGINLLYTAFAFLTHGFLLAILAPIFFIAMIIAQISIAYALIKIILSDESLAWRDMVVIGFKKIPSYLWVAVISGFIMIGGYILFIIPGIYFALVLSMTQFAFVDRGLKGVSALSFSRFLTQDYKLQMLGRGLLMLLAFFALMLVIGIISAMVAWPIGFISHELGQFIAQAISMIAGSLGGAVLAIATSKIYKELVEIKGDNFNADRKPVFKMAIVAGLGWLFVPIIILGLVFSSSFFKEALFDNIMRGGMMNNPYLHEKMMKDGMMGDYQDQIPGEEQFIDPNGNFDEAKFNQFIEKYIEQSEKGRVQ